MDADGDLPGGHRQAFCDLPVGASLGIEPEQMAVRLGHLAAIERPQDEVLPDDALFRAGPEALADLRGIFERDFPVAARPQLVDAAVAHGTDDVSHQAAAAVAREVLLPAVEEDIVDERLVVEATKAQGGLAHPRDQLAVEGTPGPSVARAGYPELVVEEVAAPGHGVSSLPVPLMQPICLSVA